MNRESTKYKNVAHGEIHKHYGLIFWKECYLCDKEFRRERGYRFALTSGASWNYACEKCCISKSHCDDQIGRVKENMRRSILGIIPAPPPMRSYRNE